MGNEVYYPDPEYRGVSRASHKPGLATELLGADEDNLIPVSVTYDSNPRSGTITRTVDLGKRGTRKSTIRISGDTGANNTTNLDKHDISWLCLKQRPPTVAPVGTIRMCDLFSGCGGISAGVSEACRALELEMEPVMAWDILESAREAYRENFDPLFIRGDAIEDVVDGELGSPVTESERELLDQLGPIDLVVGGPPCQGNSDLNNHSRRKDAKNLLYLRMTRFIEIVRPRIAIIENVLTVKRAEAGVVQRTEQFLKSIGYGTDHGALRAMQLGVPQDRRRHFTIATLGKRFSFDLLEGTRVDESRPVMWGINDLRGLEGTTTFDTSARHQKQNKERIAWLFGDDWTDEEIKSSFNAGSSEKPEAYNLPDDRRPPCHQNGHNYPAVYGRMYPNLPAPTITTGFGSTGQGRFVHPFERRSLTPHEAARVQSFPDFFQLSHEKSRVALQTLIGNAVPPFLAEHIALQLLSIYHPDGS